MKLQTGDISCASVQIWVDRIEHHFCPRQNTVKDGGSCLGESCPGNKRMTAHSNRHEVGDCNELAVVLANGTVGEMKGGRAVVAELFEVRNALNMDGAADLSAFDDDGWNAVEEGGGCSPIAARSGIEDGVVLWEGSHIAYDAVVCIATSPWTVADGDTLCGKFDVLAKPVSLHGGFGVGCGERGSVDRENGGFAAAVGAADGGDVAAWPDFDATANGTGVCDGCHVSPVLGTVVGSGCGVLVSSCNIVADGDERLAGCAASCGRETSTVTRHGELDDTATGRATTVIDDGVVEMPFNITWLAGGVVVVCQASPFCFGLEWTDNGTESLLFIRAEMDCLESHAAGGIVLWALCETLVLHPLADRIFLRRSEKHPIGIGDGLLAGSGKETGSSRHIFRLRNGLESVLLTWFKQLRIKARIDPIVFDESGLRLAVSTINRSTGRTRTGTRCWRWCRLRDDVLGVTVACIALGHVLRRRRGYVVLCCLVSVANRFLPRSLHVLAKAIPALVKTSFDRLRKPATHVFAVACWGGGKHGVKMCRIG